MKGEIGDIGERGVGNMITAAKPLRRNGMRSRAKGRSWPEEQRHFLFHNRIEGQVGADQGKFS